MAAIQQTSAILVLVAVVVIAILFNKNGSHSADIRLGVNSQTQSPSRPEVDSLLKNS